MGILVQSPPSIAALPLNSNLQITQSIFKSLPYSYSHSSPLSALASCSCTPKFELQNKRVRAGTTTTRRAGGNGGGSDIDEESRFLEQDGSIRDMDGYLNHLSLEYESVWDTKPAWCQPWTICLTGVIATSGSWIIFQSIALTTIVACLVGAWWYIFLYSYPQAYTKMIAERRKKVKSGLEDTYGVRKIEWEQFKLMEKHIMYIMYSLKLAVIGTTFWLLNSKWLFSLWTQSLYYIRMLDLTSWKGSYRKRVA